jgi:hypothetical protein
LRSIAAWKVSEQTSSGYDDGGKRAEDHSGKDVGKRRNGHFEVRAKANALPLSPDRHDREHYDGPDVVKAMARRD